MAWKEVEEKTNFVQLTKENDELIGVLCDVSKSATYKTTNIYTFNLISGISGGQHINITEEEYPGKIARLFGSTVLDQKMQGVKPPVRVKIIYLGKTIKTGRGTAKNYQVFIDEEFKPNGNDGKKK